jgi:hypothetical protein
MFKFIAGAAMAMLLSSAAQAQSPRTEDLVGRWGVAAYWNDADAAKTTAQAKSFCSQPYVISKGANGAARMFEAFEGRPQDVTIQGNEIVAVNGSPRHQGHPELEWQHAGFQLHRRRGEAEIRQYGLRALRALSGKDI